MANDFSIDGMALAPGVVETIVAIAAQEVDGVASVGSTGVGSLTSMFKTKSAAQGVEVEVTEDSKLQIAVRIDVMYGYSLPDVAAQIRNSVAEAVVSQVGLSASRVDVYIDGIQFNK
ncbi:MAG: Asp23/Gls24 family envelope stress response protein [Eggerthellaceae bacterium]|jgi:uncharacterized alkaline shock family protein YloU|nr:Asp23/Gls24 family envelope stress response protein [Eggerthellaceae bacterium]